MSALKVKAWLRTLPSQLILCHAVAFDGVSEATDRNFEFIQDRLYSAGPQHPPPQVFPPHIAIRQGNLKSLQTAPKHSLFLHSLDSRTCTIFLMLSVY